VNGRGVWTALRVGSLLLLGGCVTSVPPPARSPAAAMPVGTANAPTSDAAADEPPPLTTTRSFLIRGQHFAVGQSASLKVCVSADGAIASVELLRSSGEPGFDEFALVWARQADVSQWVRKDQQAESCGSVRVEIGRGARPRLDRGADNALG
jgi:TonB family protein